VTVLIDWPGIWRALADALRAHDAAGRWQLATEDVVRFATITALTDAGVDGSRLAVEHAAPGVGRIDLVVDPPDGVAVEFKFPREPNEKNAAYTMLFGEMLRDLYRLSMLPAAEAWAVQLLRPSFQRHLAGRREVNWVTEPGQTLRLRRDLADVLPLSARRCLPDGVRHEVNADCVVSEAVGADLLVAYRVAPMSD
jgi:hypothetical protein